MHTSAIVSKKARSRKEVNQIHSKQVSVHLVLAPRPLD